MARKVTASNRSKVLLVLQPLVIDYPLTVPRVEVTELLVSAKSQVQVDALMVALEANE